MCLHAGALQEGVGSERVLQAFMLHCRWQGSNPSLMLASLQGVGASTDPSKGTRFQLESCSGSKKVAPYDVPATL